MLDYLKHLNTIAGANANHPNVKSVAISLNQYGAGLGLNQPHRFAQYAAQIGHESGRFKFDVEVWGPTAAQERYDIRTDLGNTPERDGDGYLYRGRTGIQITGKSNYQQFYEWCKRKGFNPPDFVKNPDLVNTDPWEGLAPLWYWDTRNLNHYADRGDNENITRRINGGLNGYADRLRLYTIVGLDILHYVATKSGIMAFQTAAKAKGTYTGTLDGTDGPKTRAAIHQELVKLGSVPAKETSPAPVTEEIPVTPVGAENTGLTRTFGGIGILSPLLTFFTDMPPAFKLALVGISVVAVIILVWKAELIAQRVKAAIKAFGVHR